MFTHHAHRLAALCILATLTSYGCEDDNGGSGNRVSSLRPSAISFNGLGEPAINSTDFYAHGVTLQPAVVIPQPVSGAACPTRPPFVAPFRVGVTNDDAEDVFLSEVQINFVPRGGAVGEAVTLSGSRLVDLFGSTRIPRFATRLFPLTLPFGCNGNRAGTLSVGVFMGDSSGRTRHRSLAVEVR